MKKAKATNQTSVAPKPESRNFNLARTKRGCMTTMKSGISLYDPNFLPQADADRLFAALEKLPWKPHTMKMHGKEIPMPRRTK